MRLHFCGVRGSTPAPGEAFARYGGHTSCVAVCDTTGTPRLLLDAGTGIRRVSDLLDGAAFDGTILLGHLHWDHTQGLPFFAAGDREGARADVYLPAQGDVPAEELLARVMSPPHFPILPSQLRGAWTFTLLDEGTHTIEGFSVVAREIPHKGGRTFGYRISDGTTTVAYLSDHHPVTAGPGPHGEGELHEAALALAADADVLIHDAQYTSPEFGARGQFGHSTVRYAIELGAAAGARSIVLFHHDPARTDDELDEIATNVGGGDAVVTVAREGMMLDL